MARYSKAIDSPYGASAFEDVKRTYLWIIKAVNKLEEKPKEISCEFMFDIDEITCSVKSFSEFVEHAYGAKEFNLVSAGIYADLESNEKISLHLSRGINVYTQKKETLEKLLSLLKTTTIDEKDENSKTSVIYQNQVYVNGDNNTIANDHSNIAQKANDSPSKMKQWITAVGQNLLANWIWYLLCLAAGILVAHLFK